MVYKSTYAMSVEVYNLSNGRPPEEKYALTDQNGSNWTISTTGEHEFARGLGKTAL